jgi:hypothetical protein
LEPGKDQIVVVDMNVTKVMGKKEGLVVAVVSFAVAVFEPFAEANVVLAPGRVVGAVTDDVVLANGGELVGRLDVWLGPEAEVSFDEGVFPPRDVCSGLNVKACELLTGPAAVGPAPELVKGQGKSPAPVPQGG